MGITLSRFARTKVTQQVELIAQQHPIEMTFGKAKLRLPSNTSATYLGQI
jgi:putative transposase